MKKGVLKKGTLAHVFPCQCYETFKNNFFTEHLWTTAAELGIFDKTVKENYKMFTVTKKKAVMLIIPNFYVNVPFYAP